MPATRTPVRQQRSKERHPTGAVGLWDGGDQQGLHPGDYPAARQSAGQKRKIAERHAAGETMAELASEYDVGEATIWRALQAPQTV
jgi:hypothetical protein